MIIKRDRAPRKIPRDFYTYDSFIGPVFGAERSKVKFVFVDRFAGPALDIDFATACCILVTYHSVIGKAGKNRIHIVRITGIDVALNNWH